MTYGIKDSGQRQEYDSGMVRDTTDGKPRFDIMWPLGIPFDEQFMTRVAMHLARGIAKYGERNWERANSQEELERFKGSALRHIHQWYTGDSPEEDHAAAVVFNLIAAETVRWKMAHMCAPVDHMYAAGDPPPPWLDEYLRPDDEGPDNWIRRRHP